MTDTIYAPATPPGRGGVAVIRVSGPGVRNGLGRLTGKNNIAPRQAALTSLRHPVSHETIDQGLVLYFPGPASYTGEDVAEYHIHGGPAVLAALMDALSTLPDHRMAEPGEFTRRAFENGKMDLTAAEAVADLIDAETEAQRTQALDQLGGSLAALYNGWRETLVRSLAYLEADIDFPDEDLPQGVAAQVRPAVEKLLAAVKDHLDDNRRGERLRDGISVAIIGAPNAGKSSLLNALAGRDVAIVSAMAGTTRDIIEAHLNIGGYPVILADTAGLRPQDIGKGGHEAIEAEGIRRAIERAQQADIRVLLFDAAALPSADEATAALAVPGRTLAVFNKADLLPGAAASSLPAVAGLPPLALSVQTGAGMDAFLERLKSLIETLIGKRSAGPGLTRRRHRAALEECRDALARSLGDLPAELMAEDLRLAIRHLGRITGRVDVEDLLDVVFRDFCIGK